MASAKPQRRASVALDDNAIQSEKIHLHWEVSTLYFDFAIRLSARVARIRSQARTRNPRIPRCAIAHLRSGAHAPSRNDEVWIASSRSLSSGPPKAGPVGSSQ